MPSYKGFLKKGYLKQMAKTRTIITVQPTKKNMLFGYNYKKYV
jgi:hypothetical protein